MTASFYRFIAASGLTNLADGIAVFVWAWLASLLTRDLFLIALLPVALRLPWFICALPAGIITDRVDRQRLIRMMDLIRGSIFLLAGIAVWASLPLAPAPTQGLAQPFLFWLLFCAALCIGAAEVFRDNAAQTVLPAIVPHTQLERANGRLWSVELVGEILLGPAIGAFLIAFFLPFPFLLNAVAYFSAFLLLMGMQGRFTPEQREIRDWRAELAEGWQFLRTYPILQHLALITGFWNLFFQMALIALVLHAQENLGLSVQIYGIVLAAGAVGGILAGWVGEHVVTHLGQSLTARLSALVSPFVFFAIVFAPGPISLALALTIFEFAGVVWNTVSVSHRQRKIPDALLGRVNSIYRLFAWGMMPIGLLSAGLIVRWSEGVMARSDALIMPFIVACVGTSMVALYAWITLRQGFRN